MKAYLPALALACLVAAPGASALAQTCTPKHKVTQLVNPGKLTVAMYEYPPFAVTKGGEIGGVDGDVAQSVAKSECLQIQAEIVDPAATIQYVISGKADIAAGDWYRTAERARCWAYPFRCTSTRWASTPRPASRPWPR